MNPLFVLLPVMFAIAGYTEMKTRRIPNWLTVGAGVCALIGAFWIGGTEGLWKATLGALVGGGVFLPFCLAGALGGGDFKLMAAVGAVVGYPLVLWALYYTVLSGGALAALYLIWSGRLLTGLTGALKRLMGKPRPTGPGLRKEMTIPYGIAIAIGTLWAIVG